MISDVSITLGSLTYSASSGTWSQAVTIKNIGKATIDGPISLVLKDLSSDASLSNLNGTTVCFAPVGSPYINFSLSSNKLAYGQSIAVKLEFSASANARIAFTSEVAGAGAR